MSAGRFTVSSDASRAKEGEAVNFAVLAMLHNLSYRSDADRARNEPLPIKPPADRPISNPKDL